MSVTPGPAAPGPTWARAVLRVVIAEDAVLLRGGLRRVLTDAGLEVPGTAADAVLPRSTPGCRARGYPDAADPDDRGKRAIPGDDLAAPPPGRTAAFPSGNTTPS